MWRVRVIAGRWERIRWDKEIIFWDGKKKYREYLNISAHLSIQDRAISIHSISNSMQWILCHWKWEKGKRKIWSLYTKSIYLKWILASIRSSLLLSYISQTQKSHLREHYSKIKAYFFIVRYGIPKFEIHKRRRRERSLRSILDYHALLGE